jgi:hypothetical protein
MRSFIAPLIVRWGWGEKSSETYRAERQTVEVMDDAIKARFFLTGLGKGIFSSGVIGGI